MADSNLLDDLDINPYSGYAKYLKHIYYYFFGGIIIFFSAISVPWIYPAEENFEKAFHLPDGFAVPILIIVLIIAFLTFSISIYKGIRYLLAKRKFHKIYGK